ncbi:peptidase [Fischerella sp. PCC 9605]|uniref:peptidase n=1 Tax=Fischerella sp. PCC 9605 TaxID=1173024 RepID=UPI00047C4C5F|nr:peptidase [Fischerella sp. PCC 9605]
MRRQATTNQCRDVPWHVSTTTNISTIFLWRRLLAIIGLAISTGLLVILTNAQSFANFSYSPPLPLSPPPHHPYPTGSRLRVYTPPPHHPTSLPPAKSHPLPPTLANWQDSTNSDDYFSQIAPTQVGYLIWSQFPVKVYVETPKTIDAKQAEAWVNEVLQAVRDWSAYLPLQVIEKPEVADITVIRKAPPLQTSPGSKIPRARSAQTTCDLYNKNQNLYHRFTILLSPSQTGKYLLAAARHELGHALGIWGHSPLQSDALYFSQVRNPPPISPRDVNTLKRVYEQPTSLGWSLNS